MSINLEEHTEAARLVDRGRERGWIDASELAAAVEREDLDEDAESDLEDELRRQGVRVRDDIGREKVPATRYRNQYLAEHTADALTAFLNEREDRTVEGCRQLVWSLLTSAEFRFNH